MSTANGTPAATRPTVLPARGMAKVKSVLSGDSVILLGKATTPKGKAPEVIFTLEGVSAPRIASKANANIDEPGAFAAREWLRQMVVGKVVSFETRKQGATAGDRVYGLLYAAPTEATNGQPLNIAVEATRLGHLTPKSVLYPNSNGGATSEDPAAPEADEYPQQLVKAYEEAKQNQLNIHSPQPIVRSLKSAGEEFQAIELVKYSQKVGSQGRVKVVIEYVFDGSRIRCHAVDESLGEFQYASFTLLLAGVTSPRVGNSRSTPPTPSEPFSEEARQFVELRLLQRELDVSLYGTDKSGVCAVGTIHHPKGNIAVELLKNGLARISDWSARLMNPHDVPALRVAENSAKRTNTGIWHSYAPPKLSGASERLGTVVEVISGDSVALLPAGVEYDSEDKLQRISLASIRAPRVGNERMGRPDEPYSYECKERLRVLTVGKQVKVEIHYERDIPMGESNERRAFGTLSVKNKPDIGEVLVSEGLATTVRHRDDDETSPRYDELRAAEATAKAAKRGIHSENEYKRGSINDLTEPRKAKAYSGSLMRAGNLRAIVEYCFNGARFKMFIPSENCHIMFAPANIRCPQPSAPSSSNRQAKPAEPFGDASKRHARLSVLQRQVEITCSGVSNGGVISGNMFVGQGGQRRDYGLEIVSAGLATVDQRKIDYGEAPKQLIDAQAAAQENKVGIWSLQKSTPSQEVTSKPQEKHAEKVISIRVSEIRSGSHFFYHIVGDEAAKVVDDSMRLFTKNNGTSGAPCDVKVGKPVAALFDDGTGKSWYRAKILERKGPGKASVLFVDHGNVATVPVSSHLRPLDISLGMDRIPAVAKEAVLALTVTRPVSTDEGVAAARAFQSMCWGKDLTARILGTDDTGKLVATSILTDSGTVNEELVSSGLARVAKPDVVQAMSQRMVNSTSVVKLAADLNVAQETARKTRSGMWRYGDIGDDDDEDA